MSWLLALPLLIWLVELLIAVLALSNGAARLHSVGEDSALAVTALAGPAVTEVDGSTSRHAGRL